MAAAGGVARASEEPVADPVAEDIDAMEAELGDGAEASVPQRASADEAALPQIGAEDQLAVFELERGAYFSTDLGVFITLGGVQGNSNVQPFLALKLGHDIGDYVSLQASFAAGYSAGTPVSEADVRVASEATQNYELLNMGLELVGAIRPSPRFAIEPKVGGGFTRITPKMASVDEPMKAHVVGGVDFKYLTLLTDFSAGITINAYYVPGPDILGIGTGAVVRYTFL
jgi:hypothetical protein